ncbi:MAG TPA: glutamate-5-semialdehyde dehydrogenase [Clostridia bacterium]|nr:glutamate-5-semialdehyde dehydrogenase [Clostridia bacterium]
MTTARQKVRTQAALAKAASHTLVTMSADQKNRALWAFSEALLENQEVLIEANRVDVDSARNAGMSGPLLKRLSFTKDSIRNACQGLQTLVSLPDPIGNILEMRRRPNGLLIGKMRVPLGVVGMIYESRPNVTVDAIGLCLKTSNSVILKGGSEALRTNAAIVEIAKRAIEQAGIPADAIQFISDTDREAAQEMMALYEYIDLLIPRGGSSLIRFVKENAKVPVIETGVGNCHIYVDLSAEPATARRIVINAKTSNPAVCNAAEKLLIHRAVAPSLLPVIVNDLTERGVEVRGCKEALKLCPGLVLAEEGDWETEYLDLIMAVKVVEDIDEAIAHINRYGTGHSEAIVTADYENAWKFLNDVDAAAVYVNASTRFTDGFEFGLGAEVGISTQKLHARGPMGLEELTTTKYIVFGNGQIR